MRPFLLNASRLTLGSYVAYMLLQFRDPPVEFDSVELLVIASLKRFNSLQLREPRRSNRHTAGEPFFPLEDQFQKEIYRIIFGFNILLSPEYRIHRRGSTKYGRVDFKVGELNWAIEMVRQGDDLEGHLRRFLTGGSYYPEVRAGLITEWCILNVTDICFEMIPEVPGTLTILNTSLMLKS